ncbi:MAG: serine protease [Leptolyngbya sp. BL-A-14]
MKLVKKNLLKSLFVVILLCILAIGSLWFVSGSFAQARSQVESIAVATTVLIGAGLKKDDVEKVNESESAGSGVIIARQEKPQKTLAYQPGMGDRTSRKHLLYVYWVLTSAHVVDRDTDNAKYGIRTADGAVYNIAGTTDQAGKPNEGNSYQVKPQIHRFGEGCATSEKPTCFRGTDLAVITFYSDRKYPVAALGNAAALKAKIQKGEFPQVLVSGWPAPPNNDAKRVLFTTAGNIERLLPPEQRKPGNYNFVTTLRTKTGISGGPVFHAASGELLGIYGKGPGITEEIGSVETYAIDIGQFIDLQSTEAAYTNAFNPPPPILLAPTPLNAQPSMQAEASEFGKKYAYSGRNMSPEEFKKLYLADLLPDDPRRKPISVLDRTFGCWKNYEDGASGGGLQSVRGQFVNDVDLCLGKLSEKLAQSSQPDAFVPSEELEALDKKVQALAARLSKLSRS